MFKPRFEIASGFQKIKIFEVETFIIQVIKVSLLNSVNCLVFGFFYNFYNCICYYSILYYFTL